MSDTIAPEDTPSPRSDEATPFLLGALEAAEDGLLAHGLDGEVRYVNRRLLEILSAPDGLFEDRGVYEAAAVAGDVFADPDRFLELLERERRRPEVESRDQLRLRDGRVVHRFSRPVRVDGEMVGRVTCVRDVTELRENERRYRTLFEMSPLALVVSRPGGEMIDVNRRFVRLLGREKEAVLGRNARELDVWADLEDRADVLDRLEEGEAVRDYPTAFRTDSGEVVETELSVDRLELGGERLLVWAIRDVTERNEYRRELARKTLYDDVTGLPNRTLVHDRLGHALEAAEREDDPLSVLFVDLHDFRAVNDAYGHRAGDRVLAEAARRMGEVLRDSDTLARLGGDEFVAVLHGTGEDGAERAVRRVIEALEAESFELEGAEVPLTAHAGIATRADGPEDAGDLIRAADAARTRARREEAAGKPHFRVYGPEDEARVFRLQRRSRLREALERDEFVLHYQPVVDLQDDGRIVGAEALVRWDHPERGLIPPGDFIPFAEEAGLIGELDLWVLRAAVREARSWTNGTGGDPLPLYLAVNVSAPSYQSPEFCERVSEEVEATGLPPSALQLEITERLSVSGSGAWSDLRELGVRLAVDDFGSGYSSLRYLKQLEADILKVDRYFTQDLTDAGDRTSIILQAVLSVGQQMGMELVAEGVETPDQRDHLRSLGYRFAQGFLFARPMPAGELAERLGTPDG